MVAHILAIFSAVYTEIRKTPHHVAYHVSAAFPQGLQEAVESSAIDYFAIM